MRTEELVCEAGGQRLDAFLAMRLTGYSRAFLKGLIERGSVSVGGRRREAAYRLKTGEAVRVDWPEAPAAPGKGLADRILFEDKDLLILNKPPGLVMHPAGTSWLSRPEAALAEEEPTVVSLLLKLRPELAKLPRTGLVHRLDRETSGLLVVAKTARAQDALMEAFRERSVAKAYRAVVSGRVEREEGVVDAPVGREGKKTLVSRLGREAVTEYEVKDRAARATIVEARPLTGRTHQIRAHLALAGHPVAGDPDFKSEGLPKAPRMMLHAYRIEFSHPATGRPLSFTARLPADFAEYWKSLKRTGAKRDTRP